VNRVLRSPELGEIFERFSTTYEADKKNEDISIFIKERSREKSSVDK
jgi:hypothetical protein